MNAAILGVVSNTRWASGSSKCGRYKEISRSRSRRRSFSSTCSSLERSTVRCDGFYLGYTHMPNKCTESKTRSRYTSRCKSSVYAKPARKSTARSSP